MQLAPGNELLTRWGRRSVGNITQTGEVIPSWNGDVVSTSQEALTESQVGMKQVLQAVVFTTVSASAGIFSPAMAGDVDPSIHRLCLDAKDYSGCVRSMRGDHSPTTRIINSQGADIQEGNSCPAGYAHRGGGTCQVVECPIVAGGNDPLLAGKNHKCGNAPFWSGWAGRLPLRWGNATARTFNDENCPPGVPKVGWTSTCNYAPSNWETPAERAAREKREGPKCGFKLEAYQCSYNAYLDANPGMKQWAQLNPEMASKERARLQSVD